MPVTETSPESEVIEESSKDALESLSEADDPRAQTLVAAGLLQGIEGFEQNERAAAALFASAASQDFAPGQVVLGYMFETGVGGIARDDSIAVQLYTRAAAQGNAGGQFSLADMYMEGRGGLPRDRAIAIRQELAHHRLRRRVLREPCRRHRLCRRQGAAERRWRHVVAEQFGFIRIGDADAGERRQQRQHRAVARRQPQRIGREQRSCLNGFLQQIEHGAACSDARGCIGRRRHSGHCGGRRSQFENDLGKRRCLTLRRGFEDDDFRRERRRRRGSDRRGR